MPRGITKENGYSHLGAQETFGGRRWWRAEGWAETWLEMGGGGGGHVQFSKVQTRSLCLMFECNGCQWRDVESGGTRSEQQEREREMVFNREMLNRNKMGLPVTMERQKEQRRRILQRKPGIWPKQVNGGIGFARCWDLNRTLCSCLCVTDMDCIPKSSTDSSPKCSSQMLSTTSAK